MFRRISGALLRPSFCLAVLALLAASSHAPAAPSAPAQTPAGSMAGSPAGSVAGPVELSLQVQQETQRLAQMKQQLDLLEKYVKEGMRRRQGLDAKQADASVRKSLANAPASVISENLRVERSGNESGLIYSVAARNTSLLQILEAVAKTAGLPLEIHANVTHDQLLNRIWMNLNGVEMTELLRIAAGTQSLDVMADAEGIVVAPLTALSDRPADQRLRELAVEAYQQALFKHPGSAEAPAAYLGIARHYAASGFQMAAIQTAQNVLDRWPNTPTCGPALLLIGNAYEALREYEAARKSYYRYADRFSASDRLPSVMVMIAGTWTQEQKWTQAFPVLEECIRQWPESEQAPLARMRLAECLTEMQHYDQALIQLERLDHDFASFARKDEVALMTADCLMKLKKFGTARVRLKEVYERSADPALAERAVYALGDSLLADGKAVAALEVYRGGASQFPEGALNRAAPIRLARVYLQMGLYSKAEEALHAMPDTSAAPAELLPVFMALAEYHLQNGRHERVLALMADPRWPHRQDAEPQVLLLAARAALGSGLTAEALEKATAAATLTQDEEIRAEACRVIGECRSLMKEPGRAVMAYGGRTE